MKRRVLKPRSFVVFHTVAAKRSTSPSVAPNRPFASAAQHAIDCQRYLFQEQALNAPFHQLPQFARANGIELCYEIFGADDAEPMLLIMGLGAQMIHWDDEFCRQLAARGFRVIRF